MAQGSSSAKGQAWAQATGAALVLLCAAPAEAQISSPLPDYVEGLSLPTPAVAQANRNPTRESPKWGAHLDLEGKLGNNRDLGEADVFLPLWQDATSLLFASVKARLDDNASREGNFGLGLRHMLEGGWNLGTYGYFDRRRTETHNWFSQATFGLEALSLDWDLRANTYLPLGRRTKNVDALSTATLEGTSVVIRAGEERSLTGFDAELGWRVPVFTADADTQLRVYGGAYRFYAEGVNPVQGPRGRVELTVDEISWLWSGSRLAVGGEVQHDGPRGTTGFASARLRVPLQVFGAGDSVARLTPLERRMTDPVMRDIDIVSRAGALGAPETATTTASGSSINVLSSASTSGGNLPTAVSSAGANSTVILSGTFNTTAVTVVQSGQTLIGGGTLSVRSASGRAATVSLPSATIAGTINNGVTINMLAGSTVSGLTISNSSTGAGTLGRAIAVNGTGATISNSTVTVASSGANAEALAIDLGANTVTVRNNLISATGSGGATLALGLRATNTTGVTVSGNTFNATGATTNRSIEGNAATEFVTAASTGNVLTSGACSATGATGTVSFSNGTTCP